MLCSRRQKKGISKVAKALFTMIFLVKITPEALKMALLLIQIKSNI
jgi:hypothetical protein